MGVNMTEEMAAQVMYNLIDRGLFNDAKSLSVGVVESGIGGVGGGLAMTPLTVAHQAAYDQARMAFRNQALPQATGNLQGVQRDLGHELLSKPQFEPKPPSF